MQKLPHFDFWAFNLIFEIIISPLFIDDFAHCDFSSMTNDPSQRITFRTRWCRNQQSRDRPFASIFCSQPNAKCRVYKSWHNAASRMTDGQTVNRHTCLLFSAKKDDFLPSSSAPSINGDKMKILIWKWLRHWGTANTIVNGPIITIGFWDERASRTEQFGT